MNPCDRIRRGIQERLDGPVDADLARIVDEHVRACAACRAYDEGLRDAVGALRDLPPVSLPADALEAVWDRTIRSPRSAARFRPRLAYAWAAAAVLTAALLPALFRPVRTGPSAPELARARDDARYVLALTARTLRRTEQAGDRVVSAEVARAFRKIPIRWSRVVPPDSRRQRS